MKRYDCFRIRPDVLGYSCMLVLAVSASLLACRSVTSGDANTIRQAVVAEKGASVMPFDLDRTTHVFEKQPDGGLQQVVSDDRDETQIELIRKHLSEEASRFSRGDFHDPAMIHGEEMPGLHQLVVGHEKMSVEYSEILSGGQILYQSRDSSMVAAIHQWFDAQLADHGAHAQGKGAHKH